MLERILRNLDFFSDNKSFFINERFYTYRDLKIQIEKVYNYLITLDETQKNICILTNEDLLTYASIFATWFSGKTFIPLNPLNPISRNMQILDQISESIILSSSEKKFFSDKNEVYSKGLSNVKISLQLPDLTNDSLAYILFTSGSTGIPKGVPISWSNIYSFMDSFFSIGFNLDENDRFLQLFDFSFDVSVASYIIPLYLGACVYTVPNGDVKYTYAYQLMEEHQLTFVTIVPSILAYLKQYFNEINLPKLKYCLLTAEASFNSVVSQWECCIPNADIYNLYGPTEATIWCMYYKWEKGEDNKGYDGLLSIGKPMKNISYIIIDESGVTVKPGIKGELCISGNHLTIGYWNNPEKNNTSFFYTQNDRKLVRFYKTGDLCFYDADGDVMYCGRIDNQIQLQGFRVELNEIEQPTRKKFRINNVAAIPIINENGNTQLYLFVEAYENVKEIMKFLKMKLPHYMVPSKIISIDKFPINNSGKIDRKSLSRLIK